MEEGKEKEELFKEYIFREFFPTGPYSRATNIVKANEARIEGNAQIVVEEDGQDGVKIVLKKDKYDNIKEIKFVCTCGQTKSIVLDYSEEEAENEQEQTSE